MSLHKCPQTIRLNNPAEQVYMDTLKLPTQMTHLNEFTQIPSNNLLERVYTDTLKLPA